MICIKYLNYAIIKRKEDDIMGLLTKSKRNENDPLTVRLDDLDFIFSFDNIDKKINLDEKSLLLLEKGVKSGRLSKTKKKIVAGDYEVKLNSSEEVNNLWLKAFDKLLEYKLIDDEFIITNKGYNYIKSLDT